MACIYTYKGQEFQSKNEIVKFIKESKIKASSVNLARDVAFKTRSTGFTTVQEEEITNTLSATVLKHAIGDIENFSTTDFNDVISSYVDFQVKKQAGTIYGDRFIEVSKHIPKFVENVKKFYKSKGIEIIEELQETEDGNLFIENTLLTDPKQGASAKIRSMVSLIPKYVKNAEGRSVEDKDTFLGTPRFVEEGAMWNTLKKGLSDIPKPTFEKMVSKMDEMSVYQPSVSKLIDALNVKKLNERNGNEEVDENLRTQFFNTFALNRVEYMTVLLEGEAGKGMNIKLSTSDPSSQKSMIIRDWVEGFSFLNSSVTGVTHTFSANKLNSIIEEYNKLSDKVIRESRSVKKKNIKDSTSVRGNNSNVLAEEIKSELIKTLSLIGIEMDIAGVNNLLRSEQFQSKDSPLTIHKINKLFSREGLDFLIGDIEKLQKRAMLDIVPIADKQGKSPIEDNKIVQLLAEKQGEVLQDLSESNTLGAEGNLYSNYSTHTLVSSLTNDWNSDVNNLDELDNSIWGAGSRIAKWMRSDSKNNKIQSYVLNNLKAVGKGDQGSKVSSFSEQEALGVSLNLTLSDPRIATHLGLAEADKSRQVVIKGGKFESSGITYKPKGDTLSQRYTYSNENAINILTEYFADEILRMQAIYKNLNGDTAIPENERVLYLHDSKNTYTSYLFPEFSVPNDKGVIALERFGIVTPVKNSKGKVIGYKPKDTLTSKDILNNRSIRLAIRDSFIRAVDSDVSILESNILIEKDISRDKETNEVVVKYKNVAIDSNILKNRYEGSVVDAIADYTLNSIISSVEITKLFTGDPASFKSSKDDLFKDFRKRIPLVITGGIKARVYKNKNTGEEDVRPSYTSAVVSNIEAPSDYFFPTRDKEGNPQVDEELLQNMMEAFNESKPEEEHAIKEDILALIAPYGAYDTKTKKQNKVNITDAQAWITLKTLKERLNAFGKWTDAHQDAYERMTAKKPVLLPKDVKLFMQPLKTVHVEETTKHGHRYAQYNKQSEAVIIPGLFPGLDQMQASSPEVDHFITLDGKKVGASGVSPVNEGANMLPADRINLNYVKLSYDRLYLQQDLPTKQVKDTLVGSQPVKNLLGEVVLEGTYDLPLAGGRNKTMTGEEVVNMYHEVVGLRSDMGYKDIKEEFGFNEDNGTIDQEKFNDFLIKSMEGELTVSDIEALEAGLPIDMFPSVRKKLESKLMAAIAKKTIKLKQLGGSMVQMSGFGTLTDTMSIGGKVKDGIIWLKDVRQGLKPMQLSKEDGKLYTEKSQVLIPHKMIIDLIGEDYKNMTADEIKSMISPDVLMGLSYRIPNQATASNDMFEIVGLLPPEAGDTIISYNEITTKTGSDFDIDKAFVILPNIERRGKKIVRPKYAYEMSDKDAYEEKYNKDWSRTGRSREIFLQMEEGFKEKKEAIISKLKELEGEDNITQSLRDISKEDDADDKATSADLVEVIGKYFSGELSEEVAEDSANKKLVKETMLNLKANLRKVSEEIKSKVREQLIAEKSIPSLEKFSVLPDNQKHTRAALENLRLDLMQALLADPKTYPSAVASLDNDFLEREAKELFSPKKTEASSNLGFFKGTNQAKTKTLFDQAKNLVGVIANHMTDHKSSQADNLVYNNVDFKIGRSKDNETLVSAITDVNGVYTSTWLNLYMNAIVDAAKDPFIVSANINQFTAPVAFMLVRSGVPVEWVNAYVGQPILKELVELKSLREGKFAQKVYDRDTGKKVTPEEELIKKYIKLARTSKEEYLGFSFSDLSKLDAKQLKNEVKSGRIGRSNPINQLIILKAFNEFKETSKGLSDVIRSAKADVGNGKDLMQAEIKEAKLLDVIRKRVIKDVEKKYGASVVDGKVVHDNNYIAIDGSRMAGTFHRNGIQSASKLFSGQSVMSTNGVKNILFETIFDLNPDLLNRDQEIDTVMNEIYSFIMGLEGANMTKGDIKSVFYGDKSTPMVLEEYKKDNPESAKNNILLRDMKISHRKREGDPDFIIFNNKSQDRELYQRAWTDLFEEAPSLASKLVDYSYSASGFNRNLFSFFQFIPTQEYVNRGMGDFMNNLKKVFNGTDNLENAKDQIIKHLSGNARVIKTVANRDRSPISKDIDSKAAFVIKNKGEYIIGENNFGTSETSRALRDSNDNLYKLVGYTVDGPLYRAVEKLGYNDKGKIIKEYFTPSNTTGESQGSGIDKNKHILMAKASGGSQDIFVPLSKYDSAINKYLDNNRFSIEPIQPIVSELKDSIIARTESKTGVTDKEIQEAKKICKIK